jgi:hypothetical protein
MNRSPIVQLHVDQLGCLPSFRCAFADLEGWYMRLRLIRRAKGPSAAHNSQYGPRRAPKITAAQASAVYQQIVEDLRNARYLKAGDLLLLGKQDGLGASKRLVREVSDDLQLILDSLSWSKTSSGADVVLDLPAEQLRRTFALLRKRAVEQRGAGSQEPTDTQAPYERALMVIETCDQVLAVVRSDPNAAAE